MKSWHSRTGRRHELLGFGAWRDCRARMNRRASNALEHECGGMMALDGTRRHSTASRYNDYWPTWLAALPYVVLAPPGASDPVIPLPLVLSAGRAKPWPPCSTVSQPSPRRRLSPPPHPPIRPVNPSHRPHFFPVPLFTIRPSPSHASFFRRVPCQWVTAPYGRYHHHPLTVRFLSSRFAQSCFVVDAAAPPETGSQAQAVAQEGLDFETRSFNKRRSQGRSRQQKKAVQESQW